MIVSELEKWFTVFMLKWKSLGKSKQKAVEQILQECIYLMKEQLLEYINPQDRSLNLHRLYNIVFYIFNNME